MTASDPGTVASDAYLVDCLVTDDGIRVELRIRIAQGVEATQLAIEQARVLQEMTAWLAARKPSGTGQDHAA